MSAIPYYKTYVANPFAEENAYGARFCQSEAWDPYNRDHPDDPPTMPEGHRPGHHPDFEEARSLLPDPHWDGHGEEIAAYWKVWELAFDRKLRRATPESRFVSDFNATAFNDATFLWDSAFITLFGRYGRAAWNFQATLDNFYCKQHPDGFICREIREGDGADLWQRFDPCGTGPNILAWAEWEYFLTTGDRERLARVFAPIAAYTRWFRLNRTWPDGSYWATGWASGMDNLPRIPEGRHAWYEHCHQTWLDTCLQAVLADRTLAAIAREIGREADAAEFVGEQEHLAGWINKHLWSESTGFYHDRRADGSLVEDIKSIGAYWALLAGVVPGDRLERFVAHLDDPAAFARTHRVPALSADSRGFDPDGGYWCGAVWAPTTYMVLRGLHACGWLDLAHRIGRNHVGNVAACHSQTGTLWENYAPDSPGAGRHGRDFVGWTGLPPVAVLFEDVFGIASQADGRITWHIRLLEQHGVTRYPTHRGPMTLSCAARTSDSEPPVVHVEGPCPVEVVWSGGHFMAG